MIKYLPYIIAALALLIFLVVLLLLALRKKRAKKAETAGKEELAGFDRLAGDEIDMNAVYEPVLPVLTEEEIEYNRVKAEVEKLVQEDPASAVQVIRTWLMEDQGW